MDSAESQVGEWLKRAQNGDPDAVTELYHYFYQVAHDWANRRLANYVRRIDGATDVANMALKSWLSEIRDGKLRRDELDDAERLLITIVIRKAARAAGKYKRQPSVGLHQAPQALPTLPDETMMQATVAEISEFLLGLSDEKHPYKGLACLLGIMQRMPAPEIHRYLVDRYPDSYPSLRALQLWIEAAREQIEKRWLDEK